MTQLSHPLPRRRAYIIRKGLNLTLVQVAEATEIDWSHLARYEKGKANLGVDKLKRLAAFYGASMEEIDECAVGQES